MCNKYHDNWWSLTGHNLYSDASDNDNDILSTTKSINLTNYF